jgi:N-formylmaleamate deformylase
MSDWQEGDVYSKGTKIHYYRTGQGNIPPLVLVHGFTDNGMCWKRFAQAFQSNFDIVMVDSRNHGKSEIGVAQIQNMAADLATVIHELNLTKPVVIGHSVGASVVAALAAIYPESVSRIILEDPPWKIEPFTSDDHQQRSDAFTSYIHALSSQSVEEIVEVGKKQHPTWHAHDFCDWAVAKKQVDTGAMSNLALGDWRDYLTDISCPFLMVLGDSKLDAIVTQETLNEIETLNELVNYRFIEQAGHNIRREQFVAYLQIVAEFLGVNMPPASHYQA